MTNPRLIVLEEEEVERLRLLRVNDPDIAHLHRSLAARYEANLTEIQALPHAIRVGLGSYFHGTTDGTVGTPADGVSDRAPILSNPAIIENAVDRIRAAFTPPTQRSDSE